MLWHASPPAYNDVLHYVSSIPSANVTSVQLSIDTDIPNNSGFIGQASVRVTDPGARTGLERMDQYLLNDKVCNTPHLELLCRFQRVRPQSLSLSPWEQKWSL